MIFFKAINAFFSYSLFVMNEFCLKHWYFFMMNNQNIKVNALKEVKELSIYLLEIYFWTRLFSIESHNLYNLQDIVRNYFGNTILDWSFNI